ncbi:hypothetical protein [uncultured Flavobacterium sp.]|uniref:hypothetical protein n=1 Tax=uncultured Flavobacterium sp. TaxID=165435 RepID=UPI0025D8337F|nr:hypothetical protein [uncultured Flavobacterium sp.]
MKRQISHLVQKTALAVASCFMLTALHAQDSSGFWDRVRFGGGFGLGIGSGYTDITLAPGALYEFNEYVALGVGVQGTYVNQRDFYKAWLYGGSVIALFNPVPEVQLSAELEQLRVNQEFDRDYFDDLADNPAIERQRDFWNTALFLGAGYRMENVTVGVRYNVLFNENDMVYGDAFMPFVRVYF